MSLLIIRHGAVAKVNKMNKKKTSQLIFKFLNKDVVEVSEDIEQYNGVFFRFYILKETAECQCMEAEWMNKLINNKISHF